MPPHPAAPPEETVLRWELTYAYGEPVVDGRDLLPCVEHVGDVDDRLGDGAGELQHHREPTLHVAGTKAFERRRRSCLFIGLSDGAHTDVLRRANPQSIGYRSWIHHTILGATNFTMIEDAMGLRPRSDAKIERFE